VVHACVKSDFSTTIQATVASLNLQECEHVCYVSFLSFSQTETQNAIIFIAVRTVPAFPASFTYHAVRS
jgi:hypothetical protein